MGPPNDWIAPLIEHCLSLYSSGRAEELDVEDDGSNLRFPIRAVRDTLINEWLKGEQNKCNVTDSKTQIDAILSQESLRTYHKKFPDKPLDPKVRGYKMALEEFEVVFVYTKTEPSVHLYVERFGIAWDKPKFKGPPQGRKLKRHHSTSSLIEKVFGAVTSRRTAKQTPSPHGESPLGPQTNGASQAYATQNPFISQVQMPSKQDATAESVNQAQRGTSSTDQLLRQLGSHTKGMDTRVFPGNNQSHSKNNLDGNTSRVKDRSSSERMRSPDTINSVNRTKLYVGLNVHQPAVAPASNSIDHHDQVYEGPTPRRKTTSEGPTASATGSPTHDTRPGVSCSVTKDQISRDVGGQRHENEVQADPWQGMTKIRRWDVVIPKNQAKLFEQHARNWLPPSPRKPMPQGCVPPEILQQWNSTVLKRREASSSDSEESSSEEVVSPSPMQRQPRPEPVDLKEKITEAHSASEDDSESDEEEYHDWSPTPERNAAARPELPEDSSPIKPKPVEQKSVSRKTKQFKARADEAPSGSHVKLTSNGSDGSVPVQDHVLEQSVVEEHDSGGDVTHEINPTSHKDTDHVDSGEDSDESMMDTAVPCPLGQSSQAPIVSQSDHEVSSSGPSLPEVREHVQVMESPAANFKRTHRVEPSKSDAEHGHEQTSPQEGKSSSQSRILNTYASDNPDVKGAENLPNGTQSDHGTHNIDTMATQMSNGSWSVHDAMSLSSSAPKIRGRSPVPHSVNESVPSSKPFSSHNDVISSIEGDDLGKAITGPPSPARGVSPQDARPSPLKRLASEIDIDQKSLAKRHRISRDPSERTRGRESTTSAFNIVSRRASYISHNDDRAEAQRVFEKFRSDYPGYMGEFSHFSELCFQLRALRSQDALKRSFLWDDFIIKNLEDFPAHIERSSSGETKALSYGQFFLSSYSRPSYKKRSLTADGIEKAASQHVSHASESPVTDRSAGRGEANTSFTGSLVARFSNFHAHSLGPATEGLSDDNVDRMPTALSSPAKGKLQEQPPAREYIPAVSKRTSPVVKDEVDDQLPLTKSTPASNTLSMARTSVGVPSPMKDTTQNQPSARDDTPAVKPVHVERMSTTTSSPAKHKFKEQSPPARKDAPGSDDILVPMSPVLSSHPDPNKPENHPAEPIIPKSQSQSQKQGPTQTKPEGNSDTDADSDIDMMDVTHETASVELGEDSPQPSTSPVPRTKEQAEKDVSEDEDEDENWFVSLRHIRAPEPGWWDDPNTPMKKWAQADQNVLSERVRRPGWARMPVDEKGVIQPWRLHRSSS